MATKQAKQESVEVVIVEMKRSTLRIPILGTSPLICNRMSEKARRELLAPAGRKNAAEKAASMKHNPLEEYRASPYTLDNDDAPTALAVLPTMFKGAMMTAALRLPGLKRTEIAQLVSVEWDRMPVWGVPRIFSSVTRSADMNRTPDVRTRAIIPEWATWLNVSFMVPALREQSIFNLLQAAGQVSGIGDWRQEKGSGSFGSFTLCNPDDPAFLRIIKNGGRAEQMAALKEPEPFDTETSELLAWFDVEVRRRGFKVAA